jgi:hypothetical protein
MACKIVLSDQLPGELRHLSDRVTPLRVTNGESDRSDAYPGVVRTNFKQRPENMESLRRQAPYAVGTANRLKRPGFS